MRHKPVAIREKVFLIGISFCLSLMLWLQVSAQAEPNKQREFLIRLETRGLAQDLFATNLPDGITVIAEGPEQSLEKLEPENLTATASLAGLKVGEHVVRVRVPELRAPLRLRAKRSSVAVSLDRLATASKPVVVEVQGQIMNDLRFEGASAEPATVILTGPAKEIARVRKVRAMLDLSLVRVGLIHQVELETLGAENVPLTRVETAPRVVNVLPAVSAAPESKSLPVAPTWQGALPFPFKIRRYAVEPSTITVSGPSSTLAALYTVPTEPINLAEMRESGAVSVRLKLPTGLTSAIDPVVRVTLELERNSR